MNNIIAQLNPMALIAIPALLLLSIVAIVVLRLVRKGRAKNTGDLITIARERAAASKETKAATKRAEAAIAAPVANSRLSRIGARGIADDQPADSALAPGDSASDDSSDDSSGGEPTAAWSETDRTMATDMLQGMVAQVAHERNMDDERGAEACVVRLVPQIPIRDTRWPASWIGGSPRMASGAAWPKIEGVPANFLAQINCADLPSDIWGGLGPRTGWLAFFIHPQDYVVTAVHVADADHALAAPTTIDTRDGWFGPHGGIRFADEAQYAVPMLPQWPVDMVAIRPGDEDPMGNGEETYGHDLFAKGFDVADPAYRPLGWPTMLALADILEQAMATRWPPETDAASRLDEQLARQQTLLADAEANGEPAEEIARLRNATSSLQRLITTTALARDMNRDAMASASEVIAVIREVHGAGEAFSPDGAIAVMETLQAIRWAKVNRKGDPSNSAGMERIELIELSMTEHHRDASFWPHSYAAIHFDHAKHAYCRNPDALSDAALGHYLPYWQSLAAAKMASIGHVPTRYVHDFDSRDHVTLLELPSSGLTSLMFGDCDHLVLTMRKEDLAKGAWNKLIVQVTN